MAALSGCVPERLLIPSSWVYSWWIYQTFETDQDCRFSRNYLTDLPSFSFNRHTHPFIPSLIHVALLLITSICILFINSSIDIKIFGSPSPSQNAAPSRCVGSPWIPVAKNSRKHQNGLGIICFAGPSLNGACLRWNREQLGPLQSVEIIRVKIEVNSKP